MISSIQVSILRVPYFWVTLRMHVPVFQISQPAKTPNLERKNLSIKAFRGYQNGHAEKCVQKRRSPESQIQNQIHAANSKFRTCNLAEGLWLLRGLPCAGRRRCRHFRTLIRSVLEVLFLMKTQRALNLKP